MMHALILASLVAAGPAWAQQTPRAGDILFDRRELTEYLTGNVLAYYSGAAASYYVGGVFEYRYEPGGPPAPGIYEIKDDGMVCTSFPSGFDRCDMVVHSGERVVMIVENGDRYPIKSVVPIE